MIKLDHCLFYSWPSALLAQGGRRGIAVERILRGLEGRGSRAVQGRVSIRAHIMLIKEHFSRVKIPAPSTKRNSQHFSY